MTMEYRQRISKTDLARNTHRVIREAQRGYTVVVESHGQPEVAIVDILDFRIQRAAIRYFADPEKFSEDPEITEAALESLPDEQARCDLVIGHYLAIHMSLGRAAELLSMPIDELRIRMVRSGIPLRLGPKDMDELRTELKTIERFEKGK
jgi:predicted HTH domain antitoxin